MDIRCERFFDDIKGKKVAFIGVGVTNAPTAKFFADNGATVYACDRKDKEYIGKEICEDLEKHGVNFSLGENYLDILNDVDVVFRTPGIMPNADFLVNAKKQGKVVTSEMEVFMSLCPCKTIAVTGSDGKTTTTTIISEFLKKQGYKVHLGGNIGKALLPKISNIDKDDIAVVELSSFQLISIHSSPDIAVVTNLAPNHLDHHKDMQEYVDSKRNILLHQNAFSRAVLNYNNEYTKKMTEDVNGTLYQFSFNDEVPYGAYLDGNDLVFKDYDGNKTKVMSRDDIRLVGDHNIENYLTAITAVWGLVTVKNMVSVAREFGGVEHRIEFVRERNGVKWYNDSIATSPTRVISGLKSFDRKIIIICGGSDKGISFKPMVPYILDKVKLLILMGDVTAPKIYKDVVNDENYKEGMPKILFANSMEEAVKIADENSQNGDIVSLSPACASFDLYKNFEYRGKHFKNIVNELD